MQRPEFEEVGFGTLLSATEEAGPTRERVLVPGPPVLEALKLAGTSHIYVDTADERQLADVAETPDGVLIAEVDGNTINQPLMHKVLEQALDGPLSSWLRELGSRRAAAPADLLPLAYAAANVRVGSAIVRRFAAGRPWEVSLQLHMEASADLSRAVALGRWIHRALPSALIKVPFLPQHPDCLLAARDLERSGIPVNLTSTFSARQVAVAAMLTGAARTNVFMGRLNEGLSAKLLGEHVCLEAQRLLLRLRREHGIMTELIVASVRDWRTFVHVAGCDAFTAPPAAIRELFEQEEAEPEELERRLEASYEDELGIDKKTLAALPSEKIERLYHVEAELMDFLEEYHATPEYTALEDGEELSRRFEDEGFGDLFYTPDETEQQKIRASKVPDLSSPLHDRIALDTLFTLHADADFDKHQEAMDERLLSVLTGEEGG